MQAQNNQRQGNQQQVDENVGYGQGDEEDEEGGEGDGEEGGEDGGEKKFYDEYGNEIAQEEVENYMRAQQEQYGEVSEGEGEYGYSEEQDGGAEYE